MITRPPRPELQPAHRHHARRSGRARPHGLDQRLRLVPQTGNAQTGTNTLFDASRVWPRQRLLLERAGRWTPVLAARRSRLSDNSPSLRASLTRSMLVTAIPILVHQPKQRELRSAWHANVSCRWPVSVARPSGFVGRRSLPITNAVAPNQPAAILLVTETVTDPK